MDPTVTVMVIVICTQLARLGSLALWLRSGTRRHDTDKWVLAPMVSAHLLRTAPAWTRVPDGGCTAASPDHAVDGTDTAAETA